MRNRILFKSSVIVAVWLIAAPAFAQTKDLAGTWMMDVEKSGTKEGPPIVILTQSDKEVTLRAGGEKGRLVTYTLDGVEREFIPGVKTKAVWKGTKLETTMTTVERGVEQIVLSRDGVWLVAEVMHPELGLKKWYFKRSAKG